MVAAGMTPADVIVAATGTSAEFLGLSDMGTVATGKSADFVVLDANPLYDIANTRRPAMHDRAAAALVQRKGVRVTATLPRSATALCFCSTNTATAWSPRYSG